jgi:hypothetical protein
VIVFAFFTPAITQPFAARSSDTAPTMEAGSENRASVAPPPSRRCHAFRFRRELSALTRAARCLPTREASSKRQGDGQRFQKKAMKSPIFMREASAPANGRPSSVSKSGSLFAKGIL